MVQPTDIAPPQSAMLDIHPIAHQLLLISQPTRGRRLSWPELEVFSNKSDTLSLDRCTEAQLNHTAETSFLIFQHILHRTTRRYSRHCKSKYRLAVLNHIHHTIYRSRWSYLAYFRLPAESLSFSAVLPTIVISHMKPRWQILSRKLRTLTRLPSFPS